jgi:WD40 repeat protein
MKTLRCFLPTLLAFSAACATQKPATWRAEMAVSPDNRYACSTLIRVGRGVEESTLTAWALPGGDLLWGNRLETGVTQVARFVGRGDLMEINTYNPVTKADQTILVATDTGKVLRKYPDLPPSSLDHLVTADGKVIVSGNKDGTLTLIDMETGKELKTISAHRSALRFWAISPDGRLAASCANSEPIKLWSLPSGDLVKSFGNDARANIWSHVAFSPDGVLLAAVEPSGSGDSPLIEFFDVATGRAVRSFEIHGERVSSLVFSPDGRQVVLHCSNSYRKYHLARLWDTSTAKELSTMFRISDSGYAPGSPSFLAFWMAFNPQGRCILLGRKTQEPQFLSIWDLQSGEELKKFPVPLLGQ